MGGAQRDVGSPSVRDGRRRGRPRAQSVEDSMVCVCVCVRGGGGGGVCDCKYVCKGI